MCGSNHGLYVLAQGLKPSLYDFTERFFFTLGDAPVVIFTYSMNDAEERYHTSIGSVYMAVENMNLACLVEGLGSCAMAMGYPDHNPPKAPRQTEGRVTWLE